MLKKYTDTRTYRRCDFIFKVMFNLRGRDYINKNPKETFCIEIVKHSNVFVASSLNSVYFCQSPEDVGKLWKLFQMEMKTYNVTILFSNEVEHIAGLEVPDYYNMVWFRKMFETYSI